MNIKYNSETPDKKQVFDLFLTTGWNEDYQLSEDELFFAFKNSWHGVSAYDGDKLVGTGRIISDGRLHALIVDMIVLTEYKGRKIGSTILEMLIDKCRDHKIADIQLFCAPGASNFYEQNGFVTRKIDAPGMELEQK